MADITIREAGINDASLILQFVNELARYENEEHEVVATLADIEHNLFGEHSITKAIICLQNNQPIGFAVYFFNFSTWLGKNGLFLEDLYVSPAARGLGAGKQLLQHLAQIAVKENCGRFEWNVLDWNEPAIKFYESFGAKPQPEWISYRLEGQSLVDFSNAS